MVTKKEEENDGEKIADVTAGLGRVGLDKEVSR